MMGLGRARVRGRLSQRDGLFERLVITLHWPPFVIARGEVSKRPGGITGNQIAKADAAVFVCEDLLPQHEWERDAFERDVPRGLRFQLPGVPSDIPALGFVGPTQGDFASGLKGTEKVAVLLLFDEDPSVRRGKPHIEEDKAKGEEIGHRLLKDSLPHGILGDRTAPLLFLRLGIYVLLGLGPQVEAHRDIYSLAT